MRRYATAPPMTTLLRTELKPAEMYALMVTCIVPRPIALVTTLHANGRVNCAPYSFFSGVSSNPPCVSIAVTAGRSGSVKHTLANALRTGELVVNSSTDAIRDEVNACSVELPDGESEAELTGLEVTPSRVVAVPRIARASWAMECRLHSTHQVGTPGTPGSSTLIIAEIVAVHAEQAVLAKRPQEWKPIARLHGEAYAQLGPLYELPRPSVRRQ